MNSPLDKYNVSGIEMPDLRPFFKFLYWRPMPHSFGVPCASDWIDKEDDDPTFGIYKRCGLWEPSECAILYECARRVAPGLALDVGAHCGWTTAHMAAAGLDVVPVDPMLRLQGFLDRFEQNMSPWWDRVRDMSWMTSNEYFASTEALPKSAVNFNLVCIDGDHERGKPLEDARNAAAHLTETGVILLHDTLGQPVQEAVTWLLDHGFKARVYETVHVVTVAWRGDFVPPDFTPDPRVVEQNVLARLKDLDMSRVKIGSSG